MKGLIAVAVCLLFTESALAQNYELKARFTTNVIFASLPVAEVERLVADDFAGQGANLNPTARAAANSFYPVPEGHYPVVILQGTQADMTDAQGGIFVWQGRPLISYNEVVFLVPMVQFKGRTFNYMPRLFLDKKLPVDVGRAKQGYNKLLGEFNSQLTDTTESVQVSYSGQHVISVQVDTAAHSTQLDLSKMVSSLLSEEFLSFRADRQVVCTTQKMGIVHNSLYAVKAAAQINKIFFKTSEPAELLYSFGSDSPALRMVYDWQLMPTDVGCTRSAL